MIAYVVPLKLRWLHYYFICLTFKQTLKLNAFLARAKVKNNRCQPTNLFAYHEVFTWRQPKKEKRVVLLMRNQGCSIIAKLSIMENYFAVCSVFHVHLSLSYFCSPWGDRFTAKHLEKNYFVWNYILFLFHQSRDTHVVWIQTILVINKYWTDRAFTAAFCTFRPKWTLDTKVSNKLVQMCKILGSRL